MSVQAPRESQKDTNRARQVQKDAQIRSQIKSDLKKSGIDVSSGGEAPPAVLGNDSTVMSLNPSSAVNCAPATSILDAAKLMALTKENCVLAVDDDEELAGIFTAKDVAFRVVGAGLDCARTPASQIMTANPLCARDTTPAADALNLMVVKKFRHLPIVDTKTNAVSGLLDITKCYDRAMDKLETMYKDSRQLYDAMDTVNSELGKATSVAAQPMYIVRYIDNMKKLLTGPTLQEVIAENRSCKAVYLASTATVYDAAKLMKKHNVTAVLVREDDSTAANALDGIFTSKDVVLRVVARGLDPKVTTVADVMTPNPSYGLSTDSLSDAMRMMSEGGYLNLPVADAQSGGILGVVDVITLTRRSLIQIQTMESINEDNESDDDDEMIASSDARATGSSGSNRRKGGGNADVSQNEINQFDLSNSSNNLTSDSASGVDYYKACSFKVRVVPNGSAHRLQYTPSRGYNGLVKHASACLSAAELKVVSDDHGHIGLSYLDEDSDPIELASDQDLEVCLQLLKRLGRDKVDLYAHKPGVPVSLAVTTPKRASAKQSAPGPTSGAAAPNPYLIPSLVGALVVTSAVAFAMYRKT